MCGRFSQSADAKKLQERFGARSLEGLFVKPRVNIAPSLPIPVVYSPAPGERLLRLMSWGLALKSSPNRPVNIRAENFAGSSGWSSFLRSHRCVIPADGFYEWRRAEPLKIPVRFGLQGGGLFGMAGTFSAAHSAAGEEYTVAILTTEPNALVKPIHNRMPVMLREEDEEIWLNPDAPRTRLARALDPFPPERMEAYDVSPALNSPENDSPDLMKPFHAPGAPEQLGLDL